MKFIGELDWNLIDLENQNFLYHLERVIQFALDSSEQHKAAANALTRLIQHERSGKLTLPRRIGKILLPFFRKWPVETLDAVYTKGDHNALMRMLTSSHDRHGDTVIVAVPEESLVEWCKVSPEDRFVFAAQTCKLFERPNLSERSDDAVIGISNTARNLLALAPNKKKVLETLERRFPPNSWSGSLSVIMRQRFQHLDQLNATGDAELTPFIEEIKARLSKFIEGEEQREQERERSETASFE